MIEAIQKLKLSDTFNTVMTKINDIINIIDGKSVKIYSHNGDVVVELTVTNNGELMATKDGGTGVVIQEFDAQ